MIGYRPVSDAVRGVGRNALDLPVAAFAAVAVAFLAFAMPSDLLTDLVGSSGLPSLLPAAEPPLGFKARIGIGVAGAVLVFGLVFVLLRLLDRTGLDAREREEAPPQGPRARRRDAHPDAPAPRPISATRDFGEPAPPVAPKPLWLEPAAVEPEPLAFQAEPEPEEPAPVAGKPQPFEFRQEPEPIADQAEPEPFELHREPAPAACEPEPFEFDREPEPVEPEPVALATDPEPAPAPALDGSASIAELMARLERGLARARTGQDMAPSAPIHAAEPAPLAEAPQVFPEASDDRLQSAIDSLQRLTSRQS